MDHTKLDHTRVEPRHVAEPASMTQAVLHRLLVRILELSTLELIVATLHLALTAAAVFGLIGAAGGEGGGH